eukprot:TsM_000917200 transcript=TsM_000917200 gene=TsM_000917200
MVLNFIGIVATVGVIVTLALYSETPIVRATGRELTYLLLSGCLLCYLSSLILLVPPNPAACAIQRVGIGLGFAIMYASLLTKTNRLARIFDAAKRTTKRPAFISPRSQLAIAGGLVGLQFALSVIWLGFDPPSTRVDPIQPNFLVLRCAIKDSSMVTSLAYIMLLIVVCTIYAVKTRSIPENFNESRFIGFAMYTTCIIWLAFVPIYFATMSSFEIQISTLSVSVSLSATVTLVCLFAPKVYIIYFHPEKNIRKLTMNSGPGSKSRYATCKSPPESYGRQSSSMGTDCVITNTVITQPSQSSTTLKVVSKTQDSRSDRADDSEEVSMRPLLSVTKETTIVNALIPRRNSSDFAEPIIVNRSVARLQSGSTIPTDGDNLIGGSRPPAYQAIVSPMPLLLDNLAVSIASVPACLCDEEEESAEATDTSASPVAYGNERCYSGRPTSSEPSINAPDCKDDDADSINPYVYHNRVMQVTVTPTTNVVQNGRFATETDSIGDLWQQVKPQGVGRIRHRTVVEQSACFTNATGFPYDVISANRRLDEEKISSV